jgi:hypothetical protein
VNAPSRHVRFKQADLTRAIRGVEKAGARWGRIEIAKDGNIVILPAGVAPEQDHNPWDDE